jgi:amidase
MGRTVADVALLMNAMAGSDEADPAGSASKTHIPADYLSSLRTEALKGRRFGLVRQAMGFHPDADLAVDKAIEAMKAQGAEVVDVKIPTYNAWEDSEFATLLYEFKDGLNQYLRAAGSAHSSLGSVIAFNKANAEKVMLFFGQEIFELAQAKGPLTDPPYRKAREESLRLAGNAGLLAALERDRLDALVALSTSPARPTDYVLGDHFIRSGYSMAAAVAGTPSITVPIGEICGLPIGLTIMGRAYSIGFAYALEQKVNARRAPRFRSTLE